MTHYHHGVLNKLSAEQTQTCDVQYVLPIGAEYVALNPLIGQSITLTYTGNIYCSNCGRKTKKSYAQGHCYVCMTQLARCDLCMMKPETCHFAEGTCREPDWAQEHCMADHYVYLANTSGLKVGITRHTQIPTRWMDQGATQALPIIKVKNRKLSGLIEIELAKHVADKTNWRRMLKGEAAPMNLNQAWQYLLPQIKNRLDEIADEYGVNAIDILNAQTPTNFHYPVTQYPSKIVSHNFDKQPTTAGILEGIKGQYLIFDTGVINIRKFTGYDVEMTY